MSNKKSNASAATNQSIVNYQQQQDLMQVAALMFPSLFMAQQSNNQVLNNNTNTNSILSQTSFIQSLQNQQQSFQQQQQQQQNNDQQTKLLASLMQQQALGQQSSNDWLKLINQQTNHKNDKVQTNGSGSTVVDLSLNKTKSSEGHRYVQTKGLIHTPIKKVSKKHLDTSRCQKQGQNSSVFSINDLIGSHDTKQSNKIHQNDHQAYHKSNSTKQASLKRPNVTKSSISPACTNDQLMMIAAAMQNTQPNSTASTGNLSYDWLHQIPQKNEPINNKNDSNCNGFSSIIQQTNDIITKSANGNINGASRFENNNENQSLKAVDIEKIEAKIKIPMKHGWRRETIVKEINKNGIKGDVIYYSPCNKKLRSFQEIERYLNKIETTKLSRDNFTFSSKFIVGTFLQLKEPYSDFINGHAPNESLNQIEEPNDLKFNIYNEEQIMSKVYELNPKFRIKTPPPASNIEKSNDSGDLVKQEHIYNQIRHQQEQIHVTELKQKEKQISRERKKRDKWFEYILTREQFSSKQQLNQVLPSDDAFISNCSKAFPTIDDMQEKCTKPMPEFTPLTDSESWVGDALQVIEFIGQFAPKLRESLTEDDSTGVEIDSFENVVADINVFRQGIENKSDKLRREIAQIVQLLLRCLSQTLGKTNDPDLPSSDDSFLLNKMTKIECNENTYSEILRLYVKWSFVILTERRKLTNGKFNIDVTADLHTRLQLFLDSLKSNNFDYVQPAVKVSIMAYLCDELISTSPLLDLYGVQNNQEMVYQDDNTVSCVVEAIDETIDEFHSLRQEICQLDSKKRQLRGEKLSATSLINLTITPQPDKDKQQKVVAKLDKAISQLDKKRTVFKKDLEKCSNKLRSGKNLGQDRYLRHYWSLSTTGGLFIEAACKPVEGSMFYNEDTKLLNRCEPIKDLMEEMIVKIENETSEIELSEQEMTVANMSHLVSRLEDDNPFRIAFNSGDSDALKLTFRQIEYLIRDQIEWKQPRAIDEQFLNSKNELGLVSSSKWWLCDNEILYKQLTDCLSKRGYREKSLAKCLHKLNEETEASLTEPEASEQPGTGKLHIFNKLKSFCNDFGQKSEVPIKEKVRNVAIYREQMKALKYVYSLEDRVFSANLQQAASKDLNSQTGRRNLKDDTEDESESPIEIAVERLGDLERRIERRYLKFPFVAKKKLVKLNLDDACSSEQGKDDENQEATCAEVVVTEELCRWRNLVRDCRTTSQLVILVDELSGSIAWDKSIMKVICQICNSDSNEDKLLLCDNCDKGNHTYCFKPKLDNIPDGDWYCFVCIGILSGGDKLCCVCGSSESFCPYESSNPRSNTTDIHKCDKCSKFFHGQCLPNAKYFKTRHKWNCLNCSNTKSTATKVLKTNLHVNNAEKTNEAVELSRSTTKRAISNNSDRKGAKQIKTDKAEPPTAAAKKTPVQSMKQTKIKPQKRKANENDANSKADDSVSDSKFNSEQENNNSVEQSFTKKPLKNKKGKRPKKKDSLNISIPATTPLSTAPVTPPGHVVKERDLAMCKMIINEMGKNDSAWPFLEKVDEKGYPDYYEVIKEPMDIESIKTKLKNRAYKTKEQFAYDCRLIFDNCEFFNEDDSQIGQAGHRLRAYFETKWLKIFD